MDLNLRGRRVVVTGAASGIGKAIVTAFAAEGAHVALWDIAPKIHELAKSVANSLGVETLGAVVDVADERQVTAAARDTVARFGSIDHLVHSAAVGSGKFGFPYTNLQPADWRKVLDVNVLGMVHVAHAWGPAFRERKFGTMIFISSVAGQIGSQTDPPYSASKAANINFAQCLAKDLAASGVRVNTVCPGMVKTPLNEKVWAAWNAQQPASGKRTYEQWAQEKIKNVVPLGRWQEPSDVADMVVFLSSDRAAQVTGQTINVDGGFVMHW